MPMEIGSAKRWRKGAGIVAQYGREVLNGRGPADRRGERSDDGDSDLNGGQKAVGILLDLFQEFGLGVAGCREAGDIALAGGDDGQFGAGEKAVDQYQYQNNEKFMENRFHCCPPPWGRCAGGEALRCACSKIHSSKSPGRRRRLSLLVADPCIPLKDVVGGRNGCGNGSRGVHSRL